MINYNEPTADRRFVEQVRAIHAAGLPPAVLTGPKLAFLRRWIYGVEEAPANFICRGCTFALTRSD